MKNKRFKIEAIDKWLLNHFVFAGPIELEAKIIQELFDEFDRIDKEMN